MHNRVVNFIDNIVDYSNTYLELKQSKGTIISIEDLESNINTMDSIIKRMGINKEDVYSSKDISRENMEYSTNIVRNIAVESYGKYWNNITKDSLNIINDITNNIKSKLDNLEVSLGIEDFINKVNNTSSSINKAVLEKKLKPANRLTEDESRDLLKYAQAILLECESKEDIRKLVLNYETHLNVLESVFTPIELFIREILSNYQNIDIPDLINRTRNVVNEIISDSHSNDLVRYRELLHKNLDITETCLIYGVSGKKIKYLNIELGEVKSIVDEAVLKVSLTSSETANCKNKKYIDVLDVDDILCILDSVKNHMNSISNYKNTIIKHMEEIKNALNIVLTKVTSETAHAGDTYVFLNFMALVKPYVEKIHEDMLKNYYNVGSDIYRYVANHFVRLYGDKEIDIATENYKVRNYNNLIEKKFDKGLKIGLESYRSGDFWDNTDIELKDI